MKTKDELRALAVEKWNADIPTLDKYILEAEDKTYEYFMWTLVWQEVVMYILLYRQVEFEDFQVIVDRRGFNEIQTAYLKEMLIHIGIGEILSGTSKDPAIEIAEGKAQEVEREYTKIDLSADFKLSDDIKPEDVWFPTAGTKRNIASEEE